MSRLGRTVEEELARIAGAAHGLSPVRICFLWGPTMRSDGPFVGRLIRCTAAVTASAPDPALRPLLPLSAAGRARAPRARGCALFALTKGTAPTPKFRPNQRRLRSDNTITPQCPQRPVRASRHTRPRTLIDIAHLSSMHSTACPRPGPLLHHPESIEAVLARGRVPAPRSPRVIHVDVDVTLTLEARFLELLIDAGLPLPETNRPAGGRRVDCRWPEQQLTVELDGYQFHNSRHSWELDRRREREARTRGDEFRRYTYGDVFERPALMLAELVSLI